MRNLLIYCHYFHPAKNFLGKIKIKMKTIGEGLLPEISITGFRLFGFGWFVSDESFRQKLAVHKNLPWGIKDISLWLNLLLSQKPPMLFSQNLQGNSNTTSYKKGIYLAFNNAQ